MAPTPIELSLHSLLPTLSTLPPDLINLAQSLLSQSKVKAATLRPDEEVGRIYAVCHIAADRLRGKHGFEVGKARPPVGPRVYGKLRVYLEGVLGAPSTPKGRGRSVSGLDGQVEGSAKGNGKKTPESAPTSMRKRWAEARRPVSRGEDENDADKTGSGMEVPKYAMPMIRHLCKACDAGKAAAHVYTGVSVVLKAHGRPQNSEEGNGKGKLGTPSSGKKRKRGAVEDLDEQAVSEDNVPGVVLVLFIAVARRMYGAEKLMEMERLEAAREFALEEKNGLPAAAREEGYFDDALARFDLSKSSPSGKWIKMEWFDNVPEDTSATNTGFQDQEYDDDEDDDDETQVLTPARKKQAKTPLHRKEKHGKFYDGSEDKPGRAGLLPGLGTMFQPAVDWLSADRVREFERWKAEVGKGVEIGV